MNKILVTGGNGLLGSQLKKHLTFLSPTIDELDITVRENIYEYLYKHSPKLIVHAAAYTDVALANKEMKECWDINVTGTKKLTDIAGELNIPIIYISTDYVFDGTKGMYDEDSIPFPVANNFYAFTKFCGELIILENKNNKVIRTSFKPLEWEYPGAFSDVYTSADYVDVIAKQIAMAIINYNKLPNIIHIATERKTVWELASIKNPQVEKISRNDIGSFIPKDVSLNINRWKKIYERLLG